MRRREVGMRWVVGFLALQGCDNACQSLCVQMAELSRECGNQVSDAEVDRCIDDFTKVEAEDREICAAYNTPDAVRREWTCDDVNLYR